MSDNPLFKPVPTAVETTDTQIEFRATMTVRVHREDLEQDRGAISDEQWRALGEHLATSPYTPDTDRMREEVTRFLGRDRAIGDE